MAPDLDSLLTFADFPEDIQLNILSFLCPAHIGSLACTCRHFAALCSHSSPSASGLWFAVCDRRWGRNTQIRRWSSSPSSRLYKTLDRWEHLIGFWRRIGNGLPGTPPIIFFEWSPSCIIGSHISPSPLPGSYAVQKVPFIWIGLSPAGETISYLHLASRFESPADLESLLPGRDVIPVTISFMGFNHLVVEETWCFYADMCIEDSKEMLSLEATSPPDRVMSEIYQYFANRRSPGGERSSRRQRKKKEKERLGRLISDAEHFVKIEHYCPTPTRPLQGLWKGICEDMSLEFFIVTLDEAGGLTCRRFGEAAGHFSGYSPVFWTSNTIFLESPFTKDELVLYSKREHIGSSVSEHCNIEWGNVSRIMCINSSYELVLPDPSGSSGDPRNVEGRIWEYKDGAFGFGFLRNNYIVDLKHVALHGHLLDIVECSQQYQDV